MKIPPFKIPFIDSEIVDGVEIEEPPPVFDIPPCYTFNDQNVGLIHANYPLNIMFDMEEAIGDVICSTPPGVLVDFVELSEKACRIYDDYSQFYSLSEDVFDGHDRDQFLNGLRQTGALDSVRFTSSLSANDVVDTMYLMHISALERYLDAVMCKLAAHKVPAFSEIGCIYMPDAFIADTCVLVLRLKLEY